MSDDKQHPLTIPLSAEDRKVLDEAADVLRLPTATWVRMIALESARSQANHEAAS